MVPSQSSEPDRRLVTSGNGPGFQRKELHVGGETLILPHPQSRSGSDIRSN